MSSTCVEAERAWTDEGGSVKPRPPEEVKSTKQTHRNCLLGWLWNHVVSSSISASGTYEICSGRVQSDTNASCVELIHLNVTHKFLLFTFPDVQWKSKFPSGFKTCQRHSPSNPQTTQCSTVVTLGDWALQPLVYPERLLSLQHQRGNYAK